MADTGLSPDEVILAAKVHDGLCLLGAAVLAYGGVTRHLLNCEMYVTDPGYHDTHWMAAPAINSAGIVVMLARAGDWSCLITTGAP